MESNPFFNSIPLNFNLIVFFLHLMTAQSQSSSLDFALAPAGFGIMRCLFHNLYTDSLTLTFIEQW